MRCVNCLTFLSSSTVMMSLIAFYIFIFILAGSSFAEHGVETVESEANDVVTYATTKSSKKVKPAVQSFAAIQALWQKRLPNAGMFQQYFLFLCVFSYNFASAARIPLYQVYLRHSSLLCDL